MLRVFLQSIGSDGVPHDAILLGAAQETNFEDLTRRVVATSRGACPVKLKSDMSCVSFGPDTAVNLLLKLWINHRVVYRNISLPARGADRRGTDRDRADEEPSSEPEAVTAEAEAEPFAAPPCAACSRPWSAHATHPAITCGY